MRTTSRERVGRRDNEAQAILQIKLYMTWSEPGSKAKHGEWPQ